MPITVKLKLNPKVPGAFENSRDKILISSGKIISEQAQSDTHKVTGALRNSYHYKTKSFFSGFGNEPQDGGKMLGSEDEIQPPKANNIVNIGSNLVYATGYETKFGVLATSGDISIKRIKNAAAVILGKEFQD